MKRTITYLITIFLSAAGWASSLESIPSTFEFGWSPDDARITGDFLVRNKGGDAVDLNALKPSCGCTAAEFTPTSLGTNADTKISLTFNTRGYKGIRFSKTALLDANDPSQNLTVVLSGHVMNPNATFSPEGTGIARFEPDTKKDSQTITLHNKSDKPLTLSIVQPSAGWADIKLGSASIPPNGSIPVEIKAQKPFTEERETSVTIEAKEPEGASHRVTLAVRTGPPQKTYQPLRPTAPANDPLKLKGVDPQK